MKHESKIDESIIRRSQQARYELTATIQSCKMTRLYVNREIARSKAFIEEARRFLEKSAHVSSSDPSDTPFT